MDHTFESRRVVVTGFGCITACGITTQQTWNSLIEGRSGISRITGFDASSHTTQIGAEIKDFDAAQWMEPKDARRTDRTVHLSCCAARQCLENIPLDQMNKDRVGVVVGSGIGGITTFETQHRNLIAKGPGKVSPFFIPMMISDMAAGQLSITYGLKGPNFGTVSACASGGNAIVDAYMLIKAGYADAVLTGGTESCVTPMALAGFCSMKALSRRNDDPEKASRPFDSDRDGFVMGEGAGILFVEDLEHAKKRGADIICEIVGVGLTGDAHHMTSPAPNGEGAVRAMQLALKDANFSPESIGYINAHGTSTQLNDISETAAIKQVFGDHAYQLKVSSTKSMVGHLLGAAAAVELIFCCLAIRENKIPPTINLENPDPECDLDYVPNKCLDISIDAALSNAFGFGGHNVAIIVKRYSD
jgi:3-oxoacyl-[acyl-carrier-protein] synthase II